MLTTFLAIFVLGFICHYNLFIIYYIEKEDDLMIKLESTRQIEELDKVSIKNISESYKVI